MIHGIGTDICSIARIDDMLASHQHRLIERILTPAEREHPRATHPDFLARRYALKEATAKALGSGIGEQLSFHDILIERQGNQPPTVTLAEKAQANWPHVTLHASVSDEKDGYAVAMVVAEKA